MDQSSCQDREAPSLPPRAFLLENAHENGSSGLTGGRGPTRVPVRVRAPGVCSEAG